MCQVHVHARFVNFQNIAYKSVSLSIVLKDGLENLVKFDYLWTKVP